MGRRSTDALDFDPTPAFCLQCRRRCKQNAPPREPGRCNENAPPRGPGRCNQNIPIRYYLALYRKVKFVGSNLLVGSSFVLMFFDDLLTLFDDALLFFDSFFMIS